MAVLPFWCSIELKLHLPPANSCKEFGRLFEKKKLSPYLSLIQNLEIDQDHYYISFIRPCCVQMWLFPA